VPPPTEPRRPARDGADLEAVVDTLSFDPVLHFQAGLGASQRLVVDSRSRAPLYLSHGEAVQVRHAPSGWQGSLGPGELLFFPHGGRHELATDLQAPALPAMEFARTHLHDGRRTFTVEHPAPVASLFGSFFWTHELLAQPLIAQLPPVVHLGCNRSISQRWLAPMSQLMRWMTDLHAGGSAVGVNESANALLRQVVLALLKQPASAAQDGMTLQAFRPDAGIAPALRAIHTQPARDWSVARLAALCHMSRTAFCERFGLAVGETPLRYLTRWRMSHARRLLEDRTLSLDQVAERVGYSSGFAFSKAYKRETQVSPRAAA
jgi:AraC-like DNA-binding protein